MTDAHEVTIFFAPGTVPIAVTLIAVFPTTGCVKERGFCTSASSSSGPTAMVGLHLIARFHPILWPYAAPP